MIVAIEETIDSRAPLVAAVVSEGMIYHSEDTKYVS